LAGQSSWEAQACARKLFRLSCRAHRWMFLGSRPKWLSRTVVPGAPWKLAIATRVTYEPGARVRKHYHTSQVVFYILEGAMVVQDDGKEPVTLKPGDSLLIKPGTVHAHWNASTTGKLVFTEFILVDEGQRSVVFTEQ
jgi:quercetin dioxygenase-like cupin family protein